MHFDKITLNESLQYTVRNIVDAFTIPPTVEHVLDKYRNVKAEFDKYYHLSPEFDSLIVKQMNSICDHLKYCQPLDIERIDKYHHLHLRFKIYFDEFKNNPFNTMSAQLFYTVFFRSLVQSEISIADNLTKYIFPYVAQNKYLLFFIFDEKTVHKAVFIACENDLDLESKVFVLPIGIKIKKLIQHR